MVDIKKIMVRKILFFLMYVMMVDMVWAETLADRMRREAVEFVGGLPSDLQKMQEQAVRQAMAGDLSALEAVRNSRNGRPELPAGVTATDIGDRYRLYKPIAGDGKPLPVLIYLHGGGWCFGSVNSCARFCGEFAGEAGAAVLAVEYPLAPEHPYPAALDCCTEAVGFVRDHAAEYGLDPDAVSIGGDSAGGNLALATALRLIYASGEGGGTVPPLRSLVLFYPVVKAWNDGSGSWRDFGAGFGLDSGIMEAFNEAYVGTEDPRSALISPFCSEKKHLAQLPPVLIVNADHDILRDQGAEMHAALVKAGVNATRTVFPGTTHLFITVPGQPAAFREAVKMSAAFIRAL